MSFQTVNFASAHRDPYTLAYQKSNTVRPSSDPPSSTPWDQLYDEMLSLAAKVKNPISPHFHHAKNSQSDDDLAKILRPAIPARNIDYAFLLRKKAILNSIEKKEATPIKEYFTQEYLEKEKETTPLGKQRKRRRSKKAHITALQKRAST